MKRHMAAAAAMALTFPVLAGDADETRLAKARGAVKGLGEGLRSELMAAIKSGGPVSAISVCKTIAPALAEQASIEHGVQVRRTALRVRNPVNTPDAWERKVLEDFLAKISAGSDPGTLEHSATAAEGGETWLRYMKAIPTAAEPCLTCHGPSVDPVLKAEIDRLYPGDEATGFKAGDLRGAFSVRMKAE
jgi:hypothetical protein